VHSASEERRYAQSRLAHGAHNAKAGVYLDEVDRGEPNASPYRQSGFVNYHRVRDMGEDQTTT
jgi:hypothetical protein